MKDASALILALHRQDEDGITALMDDR
jgi:hypothetical protein